MNSKITSVLRASLCAFVLSITVPACGMDSTEEKEFDSYGVEFSLPVFVQNGWNSAKAGANKALGKGCELLGFEKQAAEVLSDPSSLHSDVISRHSTPRATADNPVEAPDGQSEAGVDFVLEDDEVSASITENQELVASNIWLELLGGAAFMGIVVGIGYCLGMPGGDDSDE